MKTINSRKVMMAFGGILVATLATGCFGSSRGYSTNSSGYNSSYSSYGDAYAYSGYNRGYSSPQSDENLYSADYRGPRRIVF
jgi:hypothetical protein